jgi:single-strand DNA-binding protein
MAGSGSLWRVGCCWGPQAETAARYLAKGRPVAIDGRLEWREWEAQDCTKRQAVSIIADSVQFLGSREADASVAATVPEEDLQPVPAGEQPEDNEIPF